MSVIWSGVTEEGAVVPVQVTDEGKVVAVGDGPQGDYLPITGGNLTGDLTLGTDNITLKTDGFASFADKVGVNTPTPGSMLEVFRGDIALNANAATDTVRLSFQYQGDEYNYIRRDNAVSGLAFGDNTGERMRITPLGSVLIGGTLPSAPNISLNADGGSRFYGDMRINRRLNSSFNNVSLAIDNADAQGVIQLNNNGTAVFAGKGTFGDDVIVTSGRYQATALSNSAVFRGLLSNPGGSDTVTSEIRGNGSATFSGDVVIGSRGDKWLIRESNGVAMLVQQSREAAPMIPEQVRDIPGELDLIEMALNEVMEKLRMTPPAGWPVWDGSDNP